MPEVTPTKRYVAIVEIIEVTETPETKGYNNSVIAGSKDSREVAKFVVRDKLLAHLKVKLAAHIELVD